MLVNPVRRQPTAYRAEGCRFSDSVSDSEHFTLILDLVLVSNTVMPKIVKCISNESPNSKGLNFRLKRHTNAWPCVVSIISPGVLRLRLRLSIKRREFSPAVVIAVTASIVVRRDVTHDVSWAWPWPVPVPWRGCDSRGLKGWMITDSHRHIIQ